MSFRARMTMFVAAAVPVAVALAAFAAYCAARNELSGQVDAGLREQAHDLSGVEPDRILGYSGPVFGSYYQVVASDGTTRLPPPLKHAIPIHPRTKLVAAGRSTPFFANDAVGKASARVYTFRYANNIAIQVAADIGDIESALARLRRVLVLVAVGGIGLATLLALTVTRSVLVPVRRLTAASEHVAATRDLSERMDASRRDELGRLAASFNTMLEALDEAVRAQRQLVADASHELRTPLTSLRTNIEVLARADALPEAEREKLLADVVEQLSEMSTLVSELVLVARGDAPGGDPETLRLDDLVAESVERARRNTPGVRFELTAKESTAEAVPAQLERAVGNLLDNAAKWSPAGGKVEVSVVDHEVQVRDHGPGIDESDVPFVFDRFYRAPSARGMPGSGLGLAIVHQVAQSHGGEVVIERPADGGTTMRLKLPAGG